MITKCKTISQSLSYNIVTTHKWASNDLILHPILIGEGNAIWARAHGLVTTHHNTDISITFTNKIHFLRQQQQSVSRLNWYWELGNTLVTLEKRSLQVIHVDHFGVAFLSALDAGLHFVLQTLDFSTYSCFYPSRHGPHPSAHSSIANASEFYGHLSAAHCISHHLWEFNCHEIK